MEKSCSDVTTVFQDAPEGIFLHVEDSLDNGIKNGMLLEIQYKKDPETYWIASITMVCGHLLRVRYIGSNEDFWCDIIKSVVKPIGWCNHYNALLDPPEGISSEDDIIELMTSMVQKMETVPNESIARHGLTPIDQIKNGMKLEVQSEVDPHSFWIATIIANVGGRLHFRYDGFDEDEDHACDFWLFYTDRRLHKLGYSKLKGFPYRLEFPSNCKNINLEDKDLTQCFKVALKESEKNPFPAYLLRSDIKIQSHQFEVGMKLEVVNPWNMSEICPASVVKVFDACYFLVSLDDDLSSEINDRKNWMCTVCHPYIFPVGWAEFNKIPLSPPKSCDTDEKFDWSDYLKIHSSIAAPVKFFKRRKSAVEIGFGKDLNIEAVNPFDSSSICASRITNVTKHLLHVYVDSTKTVHFFDSLSSNIFPPGWCATNDYVLDVFEESCEEVSLPIRKNDLQAKTLEWSDEIYFNYKCYSGPLLSKNKLSQLPKSVGPGPLSLVIREVLNMIISVAYKPAKLLKDWEQDEKPNNGQHTETLRAKLKSSTYYANIQVASKKSEVFTYCQEVCSKLQACPYLFGPTEIVSEQCPENCLKVDKSKFQAAMPLERRGRPKGSLKRKKCKKNNQSAQTTEKRTTIESGSHNKDDGESGNDSDNSPSSGSYKSENGTRPNTPDSISDTVVKKQRKKRELRTQFPPLEMKTRGAKLPNFALQIKEGHWNKKDVETIYSNTCVVPKKHYDDSEIEEDSSSSNSLDVRNNHDGGISDVSDSEEPELKKLRVTPLHDPQPTDTKNFSLMNNTHFRNNVSNPAKWSINDIYNYLKKFDECKDIADKLKEEEIDGTAFIMLNFPTMREHLKMKMKPALNLCKHVAILKWSFLSKVNLSDVN